MLVLGGLKFEASCWLVSDCQKPQEPNFAQLLGTRWASFHFTCSNSVVTEPQKPVLQPSGEVFTRALFALVLCNLFEMHKTESRRETETKHFPLEATMPMPFLTGDHGALNVAVGTTPLLRCKGGSTRLLDVLNLDGARCCTASRCHTAAAGG